MKRIFVLIYSLIIGLIAITTVSCGEKDEEITSISSATAPTATEFQALQNSALESLKQKIIVDASVGNKTIVSSKGVQISFDTRLLTKNGQAISGNFELEFIEIFDKATMILADKPTMGLKPDGSEAVLISGGEFYFNAQQDGEQLELNQSMTFKIPTDSTPNSEMTMWTGDITNGKLVWAQNSDTVTSSTNIVTDTVTIKDTTTVSDTTLNYSNFYYIARTSNFGWRNLDRFKNDTRQKATIQASVPDGYDDSNCKIYISEDSISTLTYLNEYSNGIFTAHYGQIPIGLKCHLIFLTINDNKFRWAIKGVTIEDNMTYTFSLDETKKGTKGELVEALSTIE